MQEIPCWRGGSAQTSLDVREVRDCRGGALARVHLAPALALPRAVAALRRAAPGPAEDPAARWEAIRRAGQLVTDGAPAGWTADEHAELITRSTGAPLSGARQAVAELGGALAAITDALRWQAPGGDLTAFSTGLVSHPDGRCYAWAPRGRVLGFVAPSNHPAVHFTWVMALAMGWSVALRPGADDPFTPWRLLHALRDAGFPADRIALLPGAHDLVPALIEACDRTVAYGGDALGGLIGRDERVLFNGPGRSKVFTDGPADPAFLLECILHDGGRKCTCASAVMVRGEAPGLLDDLRSRLRDLPLLDPLDPAAVVPAAKGQMAAPGAAIVNKDGLSFIQPDLLLCADPGAPPFGMELPAPWATAAILPAGADPLPLLRGSQALTFLSPDRALRQACLHEPTILKVMTGPIPPWQTEPGAPHHGRLSDFLFTAKYAPER